jgi:hypothetical protein
VLLSDDQWTALWNVFRSSGTVIASTAFIDATLPTGGFAEAEADFRACLNQLDLIAGASK